MSLPELLLIASSVISTTYGHGEMMCGDIGKPVKCELGAVTASGVIFNPDFPMMAIAAPTEFPLQARWVMVRYGKGPCLPVLLADKMNPMYISERGFDLTPAAVKLVTGKEATPTWSGHIEVCWSKSKIKRPVPKVINPLRGPTP